MEENKLDELQKETPEAVDKKADKGPEKKPEKGEKFSPVRSAVLMILGAALLVTGYFYYAVVIRVEPPKEIYQEKEAVREIVKEKITIYLPDENSEGLATKEVEVVSGNSEEERIKNIFNLLQEELSYNIVYTDEAGKVVEVPFLNKDVQLMDVFIDGKDIYLNLNYHFRDNMKTISQEIFIIYSIVNTLTEDGRYKRVKFLINNKEVEQLNFYNLSDFYEKNLEI